jgi:hypothetical protein
MGSDWHKAKLAGWDSCIEAENLLPHLLLYSISLILSLDSQTTAVREARSLTARRGACLIVVSAVVRYHDCLRSLGHGFLSREFHCRSTGCTSDFCKVIGSATNQKWMTHGILPPVLLSAGNRLQRRHFRADNYYLAVYGLK